MQSRITSIRIASYIAIALHFIRKVLRRAVPQMLSGNTPDTHQGIRFETSLYFPFWKSGALRAIRIDTTFKYSSPDFDHLFAILNQKIRPGGSALVPQDFSFDFRAFLLESNKAHPGTLINTFTSTSVADELSDKDFRPRLVKLLHDEFPKDFFFVCCTRLATKEELE